MVKEFFRPTSDRRNTDGEAVKGFDPVISCALAFQRIPPPQREAGARTRSYIGRLTSAGFSILIFRRVPEARPGRSAVQAGCGHDWQAG